MKPPFTQTSERHSPDVEFQIKQWLPIVGAVIAAVYAGFCVGVENWKPLILFVTVSVVCFVAITLQDRSWILIPLFWMATGSIALLRLPFSYRDISIMLACCGYVLHVCMVKTERIPMNHALFLLIVLNLAWFIFAWVRKPVGFASMATETVGARFYINACLAFVAIWILIRLPHPNAAIERIPYYLIFSTSIGAGANLLAHLAPSLSFFIAQFYTELWVTAASEDMRRIDIFRHMGILAVLYAATHAKHHSLFNPLRPYFWIILLGLAGIAISGFRSVIVLGFIYIGLSLILQKKWRQLALSSVLGMVLLAAVISGQGHLYSLPMSVQRTLSFLPGKWSSVAVESARSSSSRFDWWRNIIKYGIIKNWWLGDGIGASTTDMIILDESLRHRRIGTEEAVLLVGAYHNGPLTAIRCVGIAGLILLYTLLITAVVHAIRAVRQCRGTRWESLSLFLAIPIIWYPFGYTLIFGSFETDFPQIILQNGLLLLLLRMMRKHSETLAARPAES